MDSNTLESKFNDKLKLDIHYLKEKPEMQELLKFFVKNIVRLFGKQKSFYKYNISYYKLCL